MSCYKIIHRRCLYSLRMVFFFYVSLLIGRLWGQEIRFTLQKSGEHTRYESIIWAGNSKTFSVESEPAGPEKDQKLTILNLFALDKTGNWLESRVRPTNYSPGSRIIKRNFSKTAERNAGFFPYVKRDRSKIWTFWLVETDYPGSNSVREGDYTKNSEKYYPFEIESTGIIQTNQNGFALPENGLVQSKSMTKSRNLWMVFRSQGRKTLNTINSSNKLDPNTMFPIYKFDLPICGVAVDEQERQCAVLVGAETKYEIWRTGAGMPSNGPIDFERVLFDTRDYTIFTELDLCPQNSNYISFVASTEEKQQLEQADLCVIDAEDGHYLKTIKIFKHKQATNVDRAYHQWDPTRKRLFYIATKGLNQHELWYWNLEDNTNHPTGLDEKDIKSFSFSPDGKFLVITINAQDHNLKLYSVD